MKFGHDYLQILEREGFPPEWVHSAISYRQLKKCIKKVRNELLALGLKPDVLNQLRLPDAEARQGVSEQNVSIAGFHYSFRKISDSSAFVPKLTLILDPKDGSPVDAYLSPESRQYLQRLGYLPSHYPGTEENPLENSLENAAAGAPKPSQLPEGTDVSFAATELTEHTLKLNEKTLVVEIPLSSDYEFFHILRGGLSALHDLQEREQMALDRQVGTLREDIVKVANSTFKRTQHTLDAWREIFRLYIDMQIFFSTDELDSGQRTAAVAHRQLEKFRDNLANGGQARKLRKDGRVALDGFMQINLGLLQIMKFQEVNKLAFSKILKKFDKQTALRARAALPSAASADSLHAQSVAKAICQSISAELLSVVPQLSDYLCPICLNVAFKPVRLRCNHIFCIRCLVVMQRSQQNHCALCRGEVVMEATSDNLDQKLLSFLSATFPRETREKQKENDRAASFDVYGETYDACSVM